MTPASPAAPLTDAAGVDHEPAGGDVRIVSLVPSITELLFDLDLGGSVVGRTAFCVHPEGHVERARTVGGTKTVKLDRVRDLDPTHVIVNIDETPKDVADEIAATGCAVVVTHPMEPRDNIALYRLMGGLFGRRRQAEALCARPRPCAPASKTPSQPCSARRKGCPGAASSTSSGRSRG